MKQIDLIEKPIIEKKMPRFNVGDTVRVWTKIIEGENQRLQAFEGTVLRFHGSGAGRSFTVRKTSYGVGIERIYPLFSPMTDRVELVRSGKVRRAKLYYLRHVSGRAARIESVAEVPVPAAGTIAAVETAPAPAAETVPAETAKN